MPVLEGGFNPMTSPNAFIRLCRWLNQEELIFEETREYQTFEAKRRFCAPRWFLWGLLLIWAAFLLFK